jgi:ribosomal protein S27E
MGTRLALGPEYHPRDSVHSVLHRVVREHLATFVAEADAAERPVPRFVVRAFEDLLACGDPGRGFLRCVCEGCGHEQLVPFACHRRAPCVSCGGRRMAEMAAHLVDHVIPEVPVRQWVLSLPFPLRYVLAYDSKLCSAVLGTFVRTVFAWLRHSAARELGLDRGVELYCGAVTSIQRAGGAANLNLH